MNEYLKGTISAMETEASTQMIATIAPTFYLWKYLPWLVDEYGSDGPPIIPSFAAGEHTMGPYASWGNHLVGLDRSMDIWDQPGVATNSSAWDYGCVGQFQINYVGHAGKFLNIPKNGQYNSVVFNSYAGPQSYLQGIDVDFWYFSGAGVAGKIHMYINRNEGRLNNTAVWFVNGYESGGHINLTMGPRWQMVALGQTLKKGASPNGDGIISIAAKFMYNYTANTTLRHSPDTTLISEGMSTMPSIFIPILGVAFFL